jgi:hypothetical protein
MWPVAPRGLLELTVTFGPTPSPLLRRAASYAGQHATYAEQIEPGVWRAAFSLGSDPRPYGAAWRLLQLVAGWKATEVEVEGSPEPLGVVEAMASCARAWLRSAGACRAAFPSGPWAKCGLCPLYDPGWAAESFASPTFSSGWTLPFDDLPPPAEG